MTKGKAIILKPGKDKAIRHRHHWIFSGAIDCLPEFNNGDLLPVYSSDGSMLGTGYFNCHSKIIGRMISFDDTPPMEAIRNHLEAAINFRETLFINSQTNAYRLVNGEGDCLPGLIIDRYDDVLVLQFATLGMDKLREWLVEYCKMRLKPKIIYEKSALPTRQQEGLQSQEGYLFGPDADEVEILENGLRFVVSIKESQKTGFFLDQREMRQQLRQLSSGKQVLNCFSFTGAFTVYAMAGGAQRVDSVDISENAMRMAERNLTLNSFDGCRFYTEDVFQFLRQEQLPYQLIVLDPPAFAKREKDVVAACRGYKDINRLAMQKMPPCSWLLTCSCSYHVDAVLFQKVIFQASLEAGRTAKIVGHHRLAPDHPINICHPESSYLKSLLLYVE